MTATFRRSPERVRMAPGVVRERFARTLHLPRSLVLAALLVVVAADKGSACHHVSDAVRRPCGRRRGVDTLGRGNGDRPGGFWDAVSYDVT